MEMTSKERILGAMRNQEVDHLPCTLGVIRPVPGYDMTDFYERFRFSKDMGLDSLMHIGNAYGLHEDVKIETWREEVDDCEFPILWQRWKTPGGDLTQAVKLTDVNSHWENLRWGDISTSNIYKPLMVNPEDVELIPYVYHVISDEQLELDKQNQQKQYDYAKEHGLALQALYGQGLAVPMFMMGAENLLYFAIDHPEAFKKLAKIIHQTEMVRIVNAKKLGVDIIKRFGGYEMTNFYNPEIFRNIIAPLLRKEIEKAHELGLLIYYRVVTGMEPILDDLADLGFDCIEGGEPCLSNCSLEMWHEAFAGKACSWTGISTPGMIGMGTPDSVRKDVRHALEVFGKRGFILEAINGIHKVFALENVMAIIDEWKKIR